LPTVVVISLLGLMLFDSCRPSQEGKITTWAANNYHEVVERGAHVDKVDLIRDRDERIAFVENLPPHVMSEAEKRDNIAYIEAGKAPEQDAPWRGDILDREGRVVGTISGYRIQGFGTFIAECKWYEGAEGK